MPELSSFYGIVITMFFREHQPPHFHARYSGQEALIEIETMDLLAGKLPPRALGLVIEWAARHKAELRREWRKAVRLQPLGTIDPLP